MKLTLLLFLSISLVTISCQQEYYSLEDYPDVSKIDAHFHIYNGESSAVELAAKDNFRLLVINTFSAECDRVYSANEVLNKEKRLHLDNFEYTTTFCLDNWDDENWTNKTISWIDSCLEEGAVSVKVWKNIGMEFRDKNGKIVMIDHPKFDSIFSHLTELKIPLVAHLGEPRDCWLPIDEMVTSNNRGYFTSHPEYHMYLHPELPSYEEQMMARERMMRKNPELTFIGCHLASLEWSVDEIARFLDDFPNAAVDMSARMGNLFYQTLQDRERVRNFFISYQDRILYGTDMAERESTSPEDLYARMQRDWSRDWEYLVSDNPMTSRFIEGEFNGLKLPRQVIDKIYRHNTIKWYGGFD
ncbi:MAG TPA: amidohydrolase [Bacteroides sp.]|nr:amidohydrolase [Bacteroides sp.]